MIRSKEILCEKCPSGLQKHFTDLEKDDLKYVNQEKVPGSYKKGQTIYEEGYKSPGIYCIREGKIKVFKNGPDGRENIIRIVLPGEFLGIKALLTGNNHSVSAIAIEDSSVCFISKTDFFQLMIKYPDFTQSVILILSRLLDEAERRMLSLGFKTVRERLAEILVFLHHSFYTETGSSSEKYLNLTRMDIANIIGTAQETVIRLLAEFREEKLIEIRGRKIFLLELDKLKTMAGLKD